MCEYKKYEVRVYSDRTEWRNEEGHLHREDGPAIVCTGCNKHWYKHDQLHREDGLAREWSNGYKAWYLNGVRYSEEKYWAKLKPVRELTVAQIEQLLGHKVKVVKG